MQSLHSCGASFASVFSFCTVISISFCGFSFFLCLLSCFLPALVLFIILLSLINDILVYVMCCGMHVLLYILIANKISSV